MKRLPDVPAGGIPVRIDGENHMARIGDSVAATLLAAGMKACRAAPVSGAARGPYCMMGVCFDCLVTIDGRPNQQGCLVSVREGMSIERQTGGGGEAGTTTEGRP